MDRTDSEEWLVLVFRVSRRMGEGVRLLLDKGADPMIVSCEGQRAVVSGSYRRSLTASVGGGDCRGGRRW